MYQEMHVPNIVNGCCAAKTLNHSFRLSQLHQCDHGNAIRYFSWKLIERFFISYSFFPEDLFGYIPGICNQGTLQGQMVVKETTNLN